MMAPLSLYIIVFLIQFILNVGMITAYIQESDERGKISIDATVYIYCTSCALASLPVIGSLMVLMTHADFLDENVKLKLSYVNPFKRK